MSTTYISAALRREVIERANNCCEYCLMGSQDRPIDFAIDHIIAEKHAGTTTTDNLCVSCYWCNSYKGSDLSSVDWEHDGAIMPLYNPRQHSWVEHFKLDGTRIEPLSANGRVTVFLLRLNASERIKEREVLLALGVYPCTKDTKV